MVTDDVGRIKRRSVGNLHYVSGTFCGLVCFGFNVGWGGPAAKLPGSGELLPVRNSCRRYK